VTPVVAAASYERWLAIKASQGRRQFVEGHPIPFLIWREPTRTERPPAARDTARPPQVAFHTSVAGAELIAAAPLASNIDGARIYPVRKMPRRPFPERVSVGRAPNCDIVIREPSVSKLHAHFLEVTALSAELCDAKSSNGTRVNGVLLSPAERQVIEIGDRLTFGSIMLEWMDAETLYDLL
jgi:pSer/pThr/pTyr-binding forkhead associated (FHA) protein